jgi:hypothetical protein
MLVFAKIGIKTKGYFKKFDIYLWDGGWFLWFWIGRRIELVIALIIKL